MTIQQQTRGVVDSKRTILTTTSITTIYNPGQSSALVEEIHLANVTAGAVAVTLDAFDGTTARVLLQAHPVQAAGQISTDAKIPMSIYTLRLSNVLQMGEILRATAATANAIHVVVTYAQPEKR